MDSHVVLVTTGAVFTGTDQVPVDIRFSEPLSGTQYPSQRLANVDDWKELDLGAVENPRYLIVWNYAGRDLQTYPDDETRQRIADSVVLIGLGKAEPHLWVNPAKVGEPTLCGGVALPLAPGVKVYASAKKIGVPVPIRYMVVG